MKIGLISRWGDGADMAIDARRWGHECRLWIQDSSRRPIIFEGLCEKVDDYKDLKGWAELIMFDANGLSKEFEEIKKWGIPIFGGSPEGEKMEKDRDFAHGLMEKVGMKGFETESFKTIEEAIKHLKKHRAFHVVKVVGQDADSHDITISEMEGGEDAIALMERFVNLGKKYDLVEVEERIFGIEVGCAGFFNGKDWVGPIELNWQFKEIASGRPGADRGLGILCGEAGTTIRYVTTENEFFKKTLGLFSEYLRKIDYRSEIDLGTITNDSGIYPIEFTTRRGYPDLFIRRALTKTDDWKLYKAVAEGKPLEKFETLPGWAIGYLLMAPGFPYGDSVRVHSAGYPVFGYDEKNPNMHLQEVTVGKYGIEIAKGCGYAGCVTGRGSTIEAAQRNAYWQAHSANEKRLYIPMATMRSDIGDRVINQREELIELGVLTAQEWDS